MAAIEHDEQLLSALIADRKRDVSGLCGNTHWLPYAQRIESEIRGANLANFRTNYRLIKGFAIGGVPMPTEPRRHWKRAIWRRLEILPVVEQVIGEHRRLTAALYRETVKWRVELAELCFDAIQSEFPSMRIINGTANGGADDTFTRDGITMSAQWINYLARAADFYRQVPTSSVRSLIEIGPGVGLNTLAHLALNPHLTAIINCDLPAVLYLSTQFLRSVDHATVIDYLACVDRDKLDWRDGADSDGRCTIFQIPPWKLSSLSGSVDYFFNSFSFQEMEPALVDCYLDIVAPRIAGGVYVHAYDSTEMASAKVMKSLNTLSFVTQRLSSHGLRKLPFLAHYWPRYWRGDPAMCLLMQR